VAQNNQQDQGMGEDQGIDFNSLALAKFLSSSPELGNYIIGFKDVTDEIQNDDNADLKVGIFVLRVGREVFYVPVVSKGDSVYPVDSIFFASLAKFYPLTKKTIELITSTSQLSQGKAVKIPPTVSINPDMTQLIVPPRTGKLVYASASRLGDFLSEMPDYLKKFTMEKIAEEKSVYEELHKLFNIRDIFAALKPAPKGAAVQTNAVPVSVVTGVGKGNLTPDEITSIIDNGYIISGEVPTKRFAVAATNFDDGRYTSVTALDGNSDYEVILKSGAGREAFIPKQSNIGQFGKVIRETWKSVALFSNGDWAEAESFVVKGTKMNRTDVLDTLFKFNTPVSPRELETGDNFAMFDNEFDLIGVFNTERVILSNLGVEIKAFPRGGFSRAGEVCIHALRNYTAKAQYNHKTIFTPFNTIILKLNENVADELERSVNSASVKREITEAGLLGEQLNLGYDGVEFTANGRIVGSEADMMSRLVITEGIEPEQATTFVKQAKERKFAKIYLSKQAGTAPGGPGFNAGEIPQMGNPPPPVPKVGLNGSFMPNTQSSFSIKDPQATEATIISELLQNPDMFGLIDEYIPEIEDCVDKLGRVLLLSRIHIRQLAENNDADGVFSFLDNLRNVYRMLGNNLIKLKELTTLRPNESNA